jgi:hypothetical protein
MWPFLSARAHESAIVFGVTVSSNKTRSSTLASPLPEGCSTRTSSRSLWSYDVRMQVSHPHLLPSVSDFFDWAATVKDGDLTGAAHLGPGDRRRCNDAWRSTRQSSACFPFEPPESSGHLHVAQPQLLHPASAHHEPPCLEIPPASMLILSNTTILATLALYDRMMVPRSVRIPQQLTCLV